MAGGPALAAEREDRTETRTDGEPDEADAALRTRIVERIAASRSLEGSDIWVSVEDREVTLRGVVQDEATRERAVRIARRTRGVRSVASELTTDPSRAERRRIEARDENLAEQIARTLTEEVFPDARPEADWTYGWEVEGYSWEFDVEVDMGDVTLDGTVPSREDIERAITATRKVPGVRSVRSRLGFVDPLHRARWAGSSQKVRFLQGHSF